MITITPYLVYEIIATIDINDLSFYEWETSQNNEMGS